MSACIEGKVGVLPGCWPTSRAAVGAWVLPERDDNEQTGVQSEGADRAVSWEIQKQAEKNRQSVAGGRALTPNVRNVDHAD